MKVKEYNQRSIWGFKINYKLLSKIY